MSKNHPDYVPGPHAKKMREVALARSKPSRPSMGLAVGEPPTGEGKTTVWLTPKAIIDALGPLFDLDPCAAPEPRPWATAKHMISPPGDGLAGEWEGLVWMNPPYSKSIGDWTRRLVEHGSGIALVFARTDAIWWQHAAKSASAVFFFTGRVRFYDRDGRKADGRPAIPSCLLVYGGEALERVKDAMESKKLRGFLVKPDPRIVHVQHIRYECQNKACGYVFVIDSLDEDWKKSEIRMDEAFISIPNTGVTKGCGVCGSKMEKKRSSTTFSRST